MQLGRDAPRTMVVCRSDGRLGTPGGGQAGQSLVLITLAMMGLLAFVALGVDLGLFYVERVEIGRAVDAAALAAVSELPVEKAAQERAFIYLQDNGYDYEASGTWYFVDKYESTSGGGEYTLDPQLPPTVTTAIWVDTKYSRDPDAGQPDLSATSVRIKVRQKVPTVFAQFFGFNHLPVESFAEAESIDQVDSVIVYDDSGSMEFNTLCYGCWEADDDEMYPRGSIYPLPWDGGSHCSHTCVITPPVYSDYNSSYEYNDCHYRDNLSPPQDADDYDYYIVIEAEEYSRITPDYQPIAGQPFHSFWVMQRNPTNASVNRATGALGRDGSRPEAYLTHQPYASISARDSGIAIPCTWDDLNNGEMCAREVDSGWGLPAERLAEIEDILPQPVPRADYEFQVPVSHNYYFWVRGQGGETDSQDHIFWGLDGSPIGGKDDFRNSPLYDGADTDDWEWHCLGSTYLGENPDPEARTLNLWGGGPGFSVDRILITTDNSASCGTAYVDDDFCGDHYPPACFPPNNGRTGWACDACDPRFAGWPGGDSGADYHPYCELDNRDDPIFDDEQPIRDALEAAKYFVSRMDIRLDQVGYVAYDDVAQIRDELQCVRRLGPEDLDATGCVPTDPDDEDCGCRQEVITNTVLYHLDQATAGGGTNIAAGISLGIDVLATTENHYGRPGAAHVMILMTDGQATHRPADSPCDDDGDVYPFDDDLNNDCVAYFAEEARDNGIVIYTIGLGTGADKDLLRYVADLTGGRYYPATRDNLDDIFDELYERIFIRLIK